MSAVLLLSLACAAEPDAVPAQARKEAVAAITKEAERRGKIVQAEREQARQLVGAKVGVIDPKVKEVKVPEMIDKANPVRFPTAKAKADFIAARETRIKELKYEMRDWKGAGPGDFAEPLTLTTAGVSGRFPHDKVRVESVIDKRSALLAARASLDSGKTEPVTVLVSGVDTSKWADGVLIDSPPGLFYVATQKRGGTTYFHLIPIEVTKEEFDAIMRAAKP